MSEPSMVSSTELRDRRAGDDGTQPVTGKEAGEWKWMKSGRDREEGRCLSGGTKSA